MEIKTVWPETRRTYHSMERLLRPIAEYAAPLWHSGLLKSDSDKLERLQKRAVGLILGTTYVNFEWRYKVKCKTVSYEAALKYLDIPKLSE